MQISLSEPEIIQHLDFLTRHLPEKPTAVKGIYSLPEKLRKYLISSQYSREYLQELSNHMGYFLCFLTPVETDIVYESYNGGILTAVTHGIDRKASGLYSDKSFDQGKIILKKKEEYDFNHIIALLAHEHTHRYLNYYNTKYHSKEANEVLTDIAMCFLGLGHLAIPGYKPLTLVRLGLKREETIGYVTPKVLRKAIILSTTLRNWNPHEVISSFYSDIDRAHVYFRLRPYIKQWEWKEKLKEKRIREINRLKRKVEEIDLRCEDITAQINHLSTRRDSQNLDSKKWGILSDISYKVSGGEINLKIELLNRKIESLENNLPYSLSEVKDQIKKLDAEVSRYYKSVKKFL